MGGGYIFSLPRIMEKLKNNRRDKPFFQVRVFIYVMTKGCVDARAMQNSTGIDTA